MEIREERGRLIVTKSRDDDPVEAVYGILNTGLTTDEMIEEMRGPAILPPERDE